MKNPARERKDLELPVKLVFGGSKQAYRGRSLNMSETGMLVLSEAHWPRGTLVQFRFARFKGDGEVVWTREAEKNASVCRLGIKFRPLNRDARAGLSGLLDDVGN